MREGEVDGWTTTTTIESSSSSSSASTTPKTGSGMASGVGGAGDGVEGSAEVTLRSGLRREKRREVNFTLGVSYFRVKL